MDERDRSIGTQVAFKEASAHALALGLNLTLPDHQAVFEHLFSQLTESLFGAINTGQTVSNVVQAFPGTQVVPQQQPSYQPVAQNYQGYPPNQAPPFTGNTQTMAQPRIKGQSNGPFPDWALQAFAEQGVSEVYDNRHMLAANPKRPWFKSTTGGDNAPAFWPPDR